ncbi:MAG: hypothetical protein AB7O21_20120 [Gammaproteobacteria bacterium]
MNYEAKRRATLSKWRLSKRFGPKLVQWGVERRRAWQIDDSWSVDRFRRHIEQLRSDYSWQVLTGTKDVVALDKWMQRLLRCVRPRPIVRDPRLKIELPQRLSIDDIERKFRAEQPDITRARLRTLLHRGTRKGFLFRVAQGQYEQADEYHWSKEPDPPWLQRDDDQYEEYRKRAAHREECRRLVLAAHYVLPLPAARKARQFRISERRYFYDLNDALLRLVPGKEAERL